MFFFYGKISSFEWRKLELSISTGFPFRGGRKILFSLIFIDFFIEKFKINLPSFLLNNVKTTNPNETKNLSHTLIWILKKLKKKKKLIA